MMGVVQQECMEQVLLQHMSQELIDDATVQPKCWGIIGSLANIYSQLNDMLEGYTPRG